MRKVVLDTNVLISAFFWNGAPRTIVDLAVSYQIEAFTSVEILQELKTVLSEDFDVPANQMKNILRDALSYSRLVEPKGIRLKILRDPGDIKVLACALSAKADFIVTGDKDLLTLSSFQGIDIVSPKTFLERAY